MSALRHNQSTATARAVRFFSHRGFEYTLLHIISCVGLIFPNADNLTCRYTQLGAQFCLVYLFLFSTCFGQPSAHHQGKLLYLCDTGICHSVWVASDLLVGVKLQPADQTPPIQSDKYQCCKDTVISTEDGHMVARNM